VIIYLNGRKFTETMYVKGIKEKRLKYFENLCDENGEDVIHESHTRITDCVPFRYKIEEYRSDKTLRETITWDEKNEKTVELLYDLDGITLRDGLRL
jgi:hypothetical protein